MKRFLTYFFVSLGVIFFVILLALAYLWVVDPFGIKPFLVQAPKVSSKEEVIKVSEATATEVIVDKNEHLTPAQEDALSLVGIDSTGLPDTFTPQQVECFVRVLGTERVEAIKAGDAPSPLEIFQAKSCL